MTDVIRRKSSFVRLLAHTTVHLGCEDDLLTTTSTLTQPTTDDVLGDPFPDFPAIDICCIEEVDPFVDALSIMAKLSGSLVSGPKFIVPRQSRLTLRPVRPRFVYSIDTLLRNTSKMDVFRLIQ